MSPKCGQVLHGPRPFMTDLQPDAGSEIDLHEIQPLDLVAQIEHTVVLHATDRGCWSYASSVRVVPVGDILAI